MPSAGRLDLVAVLQRASALQQLNGHGLKFTGYRDVPLRENLM